MSITTTSTKSLPTPASWTDDKDSLEACNFTEAGCSVGPGKPILCNEELYTCLLECKGEYLLWNYITDVVAKITEPTKIEDIFRALPEYTGFGSPDWSKIKMVDLKVHWAD